MWGLDGLVQGTIQSITQIMEGDKQKAYDLYRDNKSYGYSKSLALQQQMYNYINMAIEQEYAKENAYNDYQYQSGLQCQQASQNLKLAQAQNELSKELNDYNSARDYANQVKYIGDAVRAYKSALVRNGYNPILALQSSMPSLGGSAHSALSSVNGVSGGSGVHTAVPTAHGIGGGSVPLSHSAIPNTGSAFAAGLEAAKVASQVSAAEASAVKDRAQAAESLERAKSINVNRTDEQHKIQSETARNYGNIATGVATGIGTAYGVKKAADKASLLVNRLGSGASSAKVQDAVRGVGESVVSQGTNTSYLGSRMLQSLLPFGFISGAAALSELSRRHANQNPNSNAAKIWDTPNFGSILR